MHQPLEKKWDKSYAELEEETRGQSEVQLWHDVRFGRVTGTTVSDLLSAVRQGGKLHKKGLANKNTYVKDQWSKILHRKGGMLEKGGTVAKNKCPINNLSCIIYGREMEGRAREQYRIFLKAFDPQSCVERMGFVAGKYAGCGCSPDGIATFQGRKYLLEIKCPATLRTLGLRKKRFVLSKKYVKVKRGKPEVKEVVVKTEMHRYFKIPQPETNVAGMTVLALDKSRNRQAGQYEEQVMFNMLMTGVHSAHLFIYTEVECGVIVIDYDESFTENMDIFYTFWQHHLLPHAWRTGDYISLDCDEERMKNKEDLEKAECNICLLRSKN